MKSIMTGCVVAMTFALMIPTAHAQHRTGAFSRGVSPLARAESSRTPSLSRSKAPPSAAAKSGDPESQARAISPPRRASVTFRQTSPRNAPTPGSAEARSVGANPLGAQRAARFGHFIPVTTDAGRQGSTGNKTGGRNSFVIPRAGPSGANRAD